MIVDVHAHALSERFLAGLAKKPVAGISSVSDGKGGYAIRRGTDTNVATLDPNLHDLPRRLESLKRRDVRIQLFGPSPGFLAWQDGAANVELVRALHEQAFATAKDSEGLMEPMVLPALGEPEKAAAELERAVGEHGFRAMMLPSSAGTRALDDPCFADLFTTIERLGLMVFMHPTSGFPTERFGINNMNVLLGWLQRRKTVLFITHSISEAIFLGDRVLVMSPRPGRLLADIPIDFERPRSMDSLIGTSKFAELSRTVRAHLNAAQGVE